MQNKGFLKDLSNKSQSQEVLEYLAIGAHSDCHFQIQSPQCSERHCRIEKRTDGFYVRDLRSQSGTFINNIRVIEAAIQEGDIIRVADKEFLFTHNTHTEKIFTLSSKNEVWNAELLTIAKASQTDFPILILGPSGSGKDILAQAIHNHSYRSEQSMVTVNCSALTETLVESELFGHIKGSFTGAISDRSGAFETARNGTLFLDEIGDLPYSLQAKLLRAIENNEIRPVGSDKVIKTNVRIIAATHQNLEEKLCTGSFRYDLFYRLNVINVKTPALEFITEDFDKLLGQFSKQFKVRFSYNATELLKKHRWHGNIRELKNLVMRASALFPGERIDELHIAKLISTCERQPQAPIPNNFNTSPSLPVIKEIEKQMIIKRLNANHGNQKRTAVDLGIPKSTLHDRLKYYNIDVEQYKIG